MEKDQVSSRAVSPIRVDSIPFDQITLGHRYRQDLGNIDDLIDSIQQNGLIHPIAVKESNSGEGYHLMAGGRRYHACKRLGYKDIPCNIYPADLSQLERNLIELCENIDRKDMSYAEEVALKQQIHKAMQQLKGVATAGRGSTGHSMRDTARMLNQSVGNVTDDIKLADAIEKLPELAHVKNKSDAMKLLRSLEREIEVEEKVKAVESKKSRTKEDDIKKAVADSYILCDFRDGFGMIQDKSVDLVELDPPYAINLDKAKKHDTIDTKEYTEWTSEMYIDNMKYAIKEAWRVLRDDGWLIFWFGIDPWYRETADMIQDAGFKMNEIPGLWVKPSGQCQHPDIYLANSYETFFYARKGNPTIKKMGKPNYFRYKPVYSGDKISKAEKPVELYDDILSIFMDPGDRLVSGLAGSGNIILSSYNIHCTGVGFDLTKGSRDEYILRAMGRMPGEYSSYDRR
jgi:ParB/RepB/Spo0J family partition protein